MLDGAGEVWYPRARKLTRTRHEMLSQNGYSSNRPAMRTSEETAQRYEAYIQQVAGAFHARPEDREDLEQTGRAALVELYAAHAREPMPALVRARIKDRMIDWTRSEYGTRQAEERHLEDCPDWEAPGELDTEAQALANIERREATQDIPTRQAATLQAAVIGEALGDSGRQALRRFRRTQRGQRTRREAEATCETA